MSVLLALVIGGCVDTAAEPAGSGASIPGDLDVAITASSYAMANVTIQRGQQVRWVNRDGVTHTVTFDDGPDSGRLSGGSSFIRGFPVAGTFTYHCSIHPAMKGTVTVTP